MAHSPTTRRFDRDLLRVGAVAAAVSVNVLVYYFQRGDILLYGDAVAHINIARRVFDSITPGPLQLGTVWLPLSHVLMIPFLLLNAMWQSGVGGSIPSMIAYVLGVVGIFRLVRSLMESLTGAQPFARVGAWVAAFAYGANPNLIYVQATALTEALYLAFFVWAMVYFSEFVRGLGRTPIKEKGKSAGEGARRALWRCVACVACAELTRYDGWFLAGVMGAVIAWMAVRLWEGSAVKRSAVKFLLGVAVVPVLWLAYNAAVFGNALEFANGPYSAQAIEQRVGAPNPAFHSVGVAALYFLKSAQVSCAVGDWGRLWLLAAIVATIISVWKLRGQAASVLLALWSPVAFYSLSIAYGSVLLHVPMWWPFAIFNQRYGLELLPMFAVSAGALAATGCANWRGQKAWAVTAAAVTLIVVSYAFVWRAGPLCWQEAAKNWEIRRGIETAVENVVATLPPQSRYLMDIEEHVGMMERMGVPLRRVVNSENQRLWKRPLDPEGIWERTLADPGNYVDYVIAFEGDLVDRGVNRTNLTLLTEIHALGRPPARIYTTRRPLNQSR